MLEPGKIKKLISRKSLPALLATLGLVVLAIGVVFAVNLLWPKLKDVRDEVEQEPSINAKTHMRIAEEFMHIGQYDQAVVSLRNALDSALTPEIKAEAGLLMGQVLLLKARTQPVPNAMMAKQYLEAVLDIEKRQQARLTAFREMIRSAALMKDVKGIVNASEEAKKLCSDPESTAELLLIQLDAQIDAGKWEDVKKLLAEAEPLMSGQQRWTYDFAMRTAMANEKIFLNESWFNEWKKDYPGISRESLHATLFTNTVASFNMLSGSGVQKLIEEARFRIARLYFTEGLFEEARLRLSECFKRPLAVHQDETLLMLTNIARREGRTSEAEEMMLIFLKRFPWNSVASGELLFVVGQAEEKGHLKEALGLIEKYVTLPAARKQLPDLLMKAGKIAVVLKQYDKAEGHFKKILSLKVNDKYDVSSMLALAEIFMLKKDYDAAKAWYVKLINRYPYERRASDALYGLSEIYEKSSTNSADIISMAIVAAKRDSNDTRAMKALLGAAQKLEEMGLTTLAQAQYDRISLLGTVKLSSQSSTSLSDSSPIAVAMLGNARCLIKMNDSLKAEKVLRDLCNSLEKGPILSEAAFWWARMAMERKQFKEAKRRMEMVDVKVINPELAALVAFEKMLLEVNIGERSAESVDSLLEKLVNVSTEGQGDFILKAYMTCFNRLLEQNDVEGMKRFFKSASSGPHAKYIPLRYFSLVMGKNILKKDGSVAFADFLKNSDDVMKATGVMETNSVDEFVGMALDVGVKVEKVSEYVKKSTNES
ncbi:MAG: hypothetical protein A2283_07160 [Lentisphaerae bacterium RIFOXYA12_FULL_48_11]|nr:MAG: hypothetical protein A2283_07160 [Lentisphaerae bacterium RIFOXYA12_FULL_48_11]